MSSIVQLYEDSVREGDYPDQLSITGESAIVGVDVDSMAGSGTSVFAEFANAVCWFWRICEDYWQSGGKDPWIPDEQATTPLREGRIQFRTLLTRFFEDGYSHDMGQELHDIVHAVLGGGWAVGGYEVSGVSVLPDDLADVLESFGNPLVEDDGDDEASRGKPRPDFDLDNPEHFDALKQRLERYVSEG